MNDDAHLEPELFPASALRLVHFLLVHSKTHSMRHASAKSSNDAFITNDNNDDEEDVAGSSVKEDNYAIFRDCVADTVIERLAPQPTAVKKKRATKARKNQIKPVERSVEEVEEARVNDAEELGDFIEVRGELVWWSVLCVYWVRPSIRRTTNTLLPSSTSHPTSSPPFLPQPSRWTTPQPAPLPIWTLFTRRPYRSQPSKQSPPPYPPQPSTP